MNGSSPLPALEVLVLDSNRIGGSLPASWAAARGGSGNSSKASPLKVLSLADNWISGALPESWATGLPDVQVLNLAGNSLAGPLPASWSGRGAFAGARGGGGGVVLLPGNKGLTGNVAPGTPFKVLKAVGGGRFAACGSLPGCGTAPGAPVVAGKLNDVEEQTLTATLELAGADAAAVKAKGDGVAAAVSKVLSKTNAKNVAVSAVVPLADAPALPGVTAAARGEGKEAGGNSTATSSPAPVPAAAAPAPPPPPPAPSSSSSSGRKLLAPSTSPSPPAAEAAPSGAGSGAQVRLTLDALRGDVDSIVKALRSAVKDGSLAAELKAAGVPVPSDLSLGSPQAEVDAAVAGGKSKGGGSGSGGKKKLSGGAVAGIVILTLLLAGALAAGLYWLFGVKGYRCKCRCKCGDCKLCRLCTLCKSKLCGGKGGAAAAGGGAEAAADGGKAAAAAAAAKAEEGGGGGKAAAAPKKSGVVPYSEYRRSRLAGAAARDAPVTPRTPRADDSKK